MGMFFDTRLEIDFCEKYSGFIGSWKVAQIFFSYSKIITVVVRTTFLNSNNGLRCPDPLPGPGRPPDQLEDIYWMINKVRKNVKITEQ